MVSNPLGLGNRAQEDYSMNCQQDDLAIVLRGPDAGMFVKCIELHDGKGIHRDGGINFHAHELAPIWKIDKEKVWFRTSRQEFRLPFCPDRSLMPIRPLPGESLVNIAELHLEGE
jgi:hypothetical protein